MKTFGKIKARGETKDVRRDAVHLDDSNDENEISVVKRKFTLSVNEIRPNREDEEVALKTGLLNIGATRGKNLNRFRAAIGINYYRLIRSLEC